MNIDENKHLLCYVSISVFCTYGVQPIKHHICRKVGIANNFFPSNHQDKDKKEVARGSYLFSKQIGICEKRESGLKSELGLKGDSPWGPGWKDEKSGV